MTDIPVLCFDGDEAGQRAAERVVELALPELRPGKSVLIAHLPEGQDPDDLVRAEGRAAFALVLEGAAPLSEAVFALETRGVVLESPDARAALDGRLRERAGTIRDQTVRRHYQQAFNEKLNALFRPQWSQRGKEGRREARSGRFGSGRPGPDMHKPMISETLRNSRLLRPGRGADVMPREAAILLCLINHPRLCETRLETLAGLDFQTPEARGMLQAVLDLVTAEGVETGRDMREALATGGHEKSVERMGAVLSRQGVWQSGADIAVEDAETGLRHALALHYKSVQLNKELRAAERALAEDLSEENLERLRDIRNQITSVDGTEALIEGFGSLSGRATRGF